MPSFRSLLTASLALALGAHAIPASGQGRELHWDSLDVEARLDSTGRLHVRERQVMVFTGDWNGGERTFKVRLGQSFHLERLARVDAATGREVELQQGDLEGVDQYGWGEGRSLRWRSRLPSDPPFDGTVLTYVIDYTLGNILVPRDSAYLLDHDFAFPDRSGSIARYTLRLALDPAWRPPSGFTGSFASDDIPPGQGFVVTVPLRFTRAGRPSAVAHGAPRAVRLGLLALLVIGFASLGWLLVRREARLGRFADPPSSAAIDERWLEANVFHLLPEAVGAAWDGRTAAPEVAAVLARLVQEKKLHSEVKTTRIWKFSRDVMHLRLRVERSALRGHERELIDALFEPGATETNTDSVRQRYSKSGFNPASRIQSYLHEIVGDPDKPDPDAPIASRMPTIALLLGAVALWGLGVKPDPRSATFAAGALGITVVVWVYSALQAKAWRARVNGLALHALHFLVPMAALAGALGVALVRDPFRTHPFIFASLVCLVLAAVVGVFNSARSRQGVERIAMRKRLHAAREYFRRELRQPSPRLRDEWFPYAIAFGLGKHVDRWFRAFGGAGTHEVSRGSGSFGSSSSSSGSGAASSWTGMGGGGGFSGGGSSGSWAAAAGLMGSSISPPSSSSSGGGSSGGGSSGGGGGGGW